MRRATSIIAILSGLAPVFVNTSCVNSPTMAQGGGVETGNSTVMGRVYAGTGTPARGAVVGIRSDIWVDDPSVFGVECRTDDSGFYRFDSVPGGRFLVTAMSTVGDSGFARTIAIQKDGDTLNLGIDSLRRASTIKGRLQRHDAKGYGDIRVGLRGTTRTTIADAQGRFEFSRVAPGKQILVAQAASLNNNIPQLMTIAVPPDTVLQVEFDIPLAKRQSLSLVPGATWCYESTMWSYSTNYQQPTATNRGFQKFWVNGDTVVDGATYTVVEWEDLVEGVPMATVLRRKSHLLLRLSGDTVYNLVPGENLLMQIPGLLKQRFAAGSRGLRIAGAGAAALYDTERFCDFLAPVILNARPNQTWYSRPAGDPRGNIPLVSRYAGNQTVTVPGGTFNCARVEWEWDLSAEGADSPVKSVDFVSDIGCVERVIQSPKLYSTGVPEDDEALEYRTRYLGADTTLHRRGFDQMSRSEYESLRDLALSSWDLDRFVEWMRALDTSRALYGYRAEQRQLPFVNRSNVGALEAFLNCLEWEYSYDSSSNATHSQVFFENVSFIASFNDSAYLDSLPSRGIYNVVHKHVTVHSLSEFRFQKERLFMLLFSPETMVFFAQGWPDCDRDWRKAGPCDLANLSAPFGRSPMAEAAAARVAGKHLYVDQPPSRYR